MTSILNGVSNQPKLQDTNPMSVAGHLTQSLAHRVSVPVLLQSLYHFRRVWYSTLVSTTVSTVVSTVVSIAFSNAVRDSAPRPLGTVRGTQAFRSPILATFSLEDSIGHGSTSFCRGANEVAIWLYPTAVHVGLYP